MSSVGGVSGSGDPPIPPSKTISEMRPYYYDPRSYRIQQLRSDEISEVEKAMMYFPRCNATSMAGKLIESLEMFFKGTFLQVQDAHLLRRADTEGNVSSYDLTVARLRATANVIGKTVLGVTFAASLPLGIALAIAGAVTGGLGLLTISKGEMNPQAGIYVGALIGAGISAAVCASLGLVGSFLVAGTEPNVNAINRVKMVAVGTFMPLYLSLVGSSPVVGITHDMAMINSLMAGNMTGFLWLYAFGLPF